MASANASDDRGIAGQKNVGPTSMCVGAVDNVGDGKLVAKVCKISAIFANSYTCKSADPNTASSILSSSSVAVSILSSIS